MAKNYRLNVINLSLLQKSSFCLKSNYQTCLHFSVPSPCYLIPSLWTKHGQNKGTRHTKESMRRENDDINNAPYSVSFCPMHHAVSQITKIAVTAQPFRRLRSCPSLAGELWGTKSFGKQRDFRSTL